MPHRSKPTAATLAWLTAAAMAMAGPASALSCMAPDPVAAFSSANAAEEIYVVVLGSFSGGPGPRPGDPAGAPTPRTYMAMFNGHSLNRDGPFEAINRTIIVEETCAADWCADIPNDVPVLTFFRVEPSGPPVATFGPCYANAFFDPTPDQIEAIKSCFANGCTEM